MFVNTLCAAFCSMLAINTEGVMDSLGVFWKGMLAIAIVIALIILVTVVMNAVSNAVIKKREQKSAADDGGSEGNGNN